MDHAPMTSEPDEITKLLKAWSSGDRSVLERLMALVYNDLHRLAHRQMAAEREGHTLQTTALVHEAYLRLVDSDRATWQDRAHFFAVCARLMRNILVDAARSRRSQKRGEEFRIVEFDEAIAAPAKQAVDIIALDMALNKLREFDERKSRALELRIFGGLSVEETAAILRVSTDTVTRDVHLATAWLRRELCGDPSRGE